VNQTLSALKAMSWTASLPFKGHFCLETDVFNASLETEYDLFQYTTSIYRGAKHIIRLSPSLCPSLVNLKRILEAIVLSQTYFELQIRWELFPCFQWFWFAFANQCHRFSAV
jgi:hypothetical protein